MCLAALHCAFLCLAVLSCASLCLTAPHCALLCLAVLYCAYCASLRFTVRCSVSLCFTVLYCALLCFVVLCCALLCFAVLCCALLCFTVLGCALQEMVIKFYCLSTIGSNSGLGYASAQDEENEVSFCSKVKYHSYKAFQNYWKSGSNRFDLMICVFSWFSLFMEGVGVNIKVLRIFRALRLTRVLRKVESVRKVLDASLQAVRPMFNIL